MTRRTVLLLLLAAVLAFAATAASAVSAHGRTSDVDWIRRAKKCQGTVAECLGDVDEFEVGSGGDMLMRRRLDDTSGYISYGALMADIVPCSVRGASYYNCQPGADANPYTRGCSAITQCRD